jgi:hypothetical protein
MGIAGFIAIPSGQGHGSMSLLLFIENTYDNQTLVFNEKTQDYFTSFRPGTWRAWCFLGGDYVQRVKTKLFSLSI